MNGSAAAGASQLGDGSCWPGIVAGKGAEMALRATALLVGAASAAASPKNVLYMIVDVRSPRSLPRPPPHSASAACR